jgi:hypothetical protein
MPHVVRLHAEVMKSGNAADCRGQSLGNRYLASIGQVGNTIDGVRVDLRVKSTADIARSAAEPDQVVGRRNRLNLEPIRFQP